MRYQEFKLFPTTVLKFDCSDIFLKEEIEALITDVNEICNVDSLMQLDDLTPRYQSFPILFKENAPHHWQKLKQSFLTSCKLYLDIVDSFGKNVNAIEFIHARAWFYKSWKSLNSIQPNPWHNHSPSFLSGVFYLKLPVEDKNSGTEFSDPRISEATVAQNQSVEGSLLSWVIFPGWLSHKAGSCESEDPRITIAADSYVKVI